MGAGTHRLDSSYDWRRKVCTPSLRSQLRALKEAAEHQAAPGGREGEAAGPKEQVKALERKHAALRKAHEKTGG
ncbi:hypothetical protein DIPPA_23591 [Diplonema papillatum]|nr:hypothetical protein DIPPA_23591 [Diplonema papillatum]